VEEPLSVKDATDATRAANQAVAAALPLDDPDDFTLASRGHMAGPPGAVLNEWEFPVWNLEDFAFVDGAAPGTVNPSLWRQARLNNHGGLFRVTDGIYQVRGFDISNITFVATDSGWIVIDPLTTAETARAAMTLLHEHVDPRPVRAVIYTHSHIDHFGGVRGVVDEADVTSGRVPILAPEGFLEAAISENVLAGNAMFRRASYMYGALLPRNASGHVDAGLGKGVPLLGTSGLLAPTDQIATTGEEREIDGVRIVFQVTPDTEAPAEMNFFFPDAGALCMAENCSANLHNLYTPRGAQVRDALAWSHYIDEAIELFGRQADTIFMSHHWPQPGGADGVEYMRTQRDVYRYLHDQTLRLANHGLTMIEIAEELTLPAALEREFSVRGYYGTVNHNVKAIYQRYLGWFDANPAHLHPLPPTEAGRRYVDFMGGADEVLRRARESFDQGEYRWVAEVVSHVVFAEPDNAAALQLQADTFEQLGYQAESGPWRGFYLTAAQELRNGIAELGSGGLVNPDVASAMTTDMLLDYLAMRLNGPDAAHLRAVVELNVTDREDQRIIEVRNGTLHHRTGVVLEADVSLRVTQVGLIALGLGTAPLDDLVADGTVEIDGDRAVIDEFLGHLDTFAVWFPIASP
jgi:alkyl sulfatase BDS1-like metallo-beta-lactamase superfamily hydrolase